MLKNKKIKKNYNFSFFFTLFFLCVCVCVFFMVFLYFKDIILKKNLIQFINDMILLGQLAHVSGLGWHLTVRG